MNKKGFTLVELLAVIAILAILVIIALPNVLSMFRDAKKNTFKEESQKIFQTAETAYINSAMGTTPIKCFSSEGPNKLDLTGRDTIKYKVVFDDSGNITSFATSDGSYHTTASGSAVKVTNVELTDSAPTIDACPE